MSTDGEGPGSDFLHVRQIVMISEEIICRREKTRERSEEGERERGGERGGGGGRETCAYLVAFSNASHERVMFPKMRFK